jgi:LacI family transcriptional regulator
VLAEAGIPHVFVNRAVPGSGRNVTLDVGSASRLAVEHLAGLGHRRIVHLAGPTDVAPSRERRLAFEAAIAERGLDNLPAVESGFLEAEGREAVASVLRAEPTAVVTSSLGQAIGLLRGMHERGVRVPDDVSVVAYDDFPLAAATIPALTTVAMPLDELGAAAVDALLAQLAGEPPTDVSVATAPRLVIRESTAPPRP